MPPINLRPELAQHLQQRVRAFQDGFRHNIALIGPPGSGKSFQLQELIAQQPDSVLVINCSIYRESCRTFLSRFLQTIVHAGLEATNCGSPAHDLERAGTNLPRTVSAVRAVEGLLARRAYHEAFIRALDVIPVMSKERRKPCILILDEFLFLEDLGLTHAFKEVGKRIMTWPSTLFVLSSSTPSRAQHILQDRLQLLFGRFELLTLEGLDRPSVTAWIRQELDGLDGVEPIVPFLIWWLGASPRYLGVLLKRMNELARLREHACVTEDVFLEGAWDVLGSPEGSLYQSCASRIEPLAHVRHGARAVEALLQIANGARTTTEIGRRIGRGGLREATSMLAERDLTIRNGMCWMTPDPVLRCWLSTMLWAQRCDLSTGATSLQARLSSYLQALWGQWMLHERRSLPEQVASLFERFGDEMVSLDQKTGRLPRFERIEARREDDGGGTYLVAEGDGKRWYCSVVEERVTEPSVASFEQFCRQRHPKPSRKVIVTKAGLDENAKLLAKAANMWVWGARELETLAGLYGEQAMPEAHAGR